VKALNFHPFSERDRFSTVPKARGVSNPLVVLQLGRPAKEAPTKRFWESNSILLLQFPWGSFAFIFTADMIIDAVEQHLCSMWILKSKERDSM
jgi:hypothetical protein